MAKATVEIDLDGVLSHGSAPAILGPEAGAESRAWVVYLPAEIPCICDSFTDASALMADWLGGRKRRRG